MAHGRTSVGVLNEAGQDVEVLAREDWGEVGRRGRPPACLQMVRIQQQIWACRIMKKSKFNMFWKLGGKQPPSRWVAWAFMLQSLDTPTNRGQDFLGQTPPPIIMLMR